MFESLKRFLSEWRPINSDYRPDDHPTPTEDECVSTASVEAPGPPGSYASAAEVWDGV